MISRSPFTGLENRSDEPQFRYVKDNLKEAAGLWGETLLFDGVKPYPGSTFSLAGRAEVE